MWLGSLGNILAGNCLQPPPFHSHPRLSLAAQRALLSPDQMIFLSVSEDFKLGGKGWD